MHPLVKSKSQGPQKPSQEGLAGTGLKCALAQNLSQAPTLPHVFHGARAAASCQINQPLCVCVLEEREWSGGGGGSVCQNRPPECFEGPAVWMSKYFPVQMKGAIIAGF